MRRIAVTPVKWDNLLDEKRIYKRIAKVARPYPNQHPTPHNHTHQPPTHTQKRFQSQGVAWIKKNDIILD